MNADGTFLMKEQDFWEIDRRENSGHIDTWIEYLCLERSGPGTCELTIKSHVIIDSEYDGNLISDYYDDITGEYDLPEEIQGIKVLGWNSEFLLGVPLENNFQYETLKLSRGNVEHEIRQWIKDVKWDLSNEQISSINKFVSEWTKLLGEFSNWNQIQMMNWKTSTKESKVRSMR